MTRATASSPGKDVLSRRKKILFSLIVSGIVVVLAFGIAEIFLRIVPIPGVNYHTFYYDEITGGRHYPHSTLIYRNDRNDYAKRKINSRGYPDVEHEVEKAPGVVRLGFFGDSYTEARQVPLGDTFFRVIQKELSSLSDADSIEIISLGVSGRGTFQSYLDSQTWADSLDLDIVYYVFCENDPGDNVPVITRVTTRPYAILSGDSLVFDFSFRDRYKHKTGTLHRTWQYCKSRSLLCSVLQERTMLLRRRGIKMRMGEADKKMAGEAKAGSMPRPTDAPSSWPDSLCEEAKSVTERVIVRWNRELEAENRDFAVIYIPREAEMTKPVESQDSWAKMVYDVCNRHDIDVIDPSQRFSEAAEQGGEMYYDHLTKEGHRVLADVFVEYYLNRPN